MKPVLRNALIGVAGLFAASVQLSEQKGWSDPDGPVSDRLGAKTRVDDTPIKVFDGLPPFEKACPSPTGEDADLTIRVCEITGEFNEIADTAVYTKNIFDKSGVKIGEAPAREIPVIRLVPSGPKQP